MNSNNEEDDPLGALQKQKQPRIHKKSKLTKIPSNIVMMALVFLVTIVFSVQNAVMIV